MPILIALALATLPAQPATTPALADIGPAPAVELIDSSAQPFRLADLHGKVVLVSFIYTTCNGTCPATTHNLYRIQRDLQEAGLWGESVAFVSISLDPANDTPETLSRYADVYGCDPAAWHFLTGTPEAVGSVLAAWDMWARRDPRTGLLDHPSRIFLLDTRGHQREIYSLEFLRGPAVLADVRALLAEPARP